MQDTISKNTGNSRSLKTVPNALTLYPTYEAMIAAMVNGTFPIDLCPLNPAGLVKKGDDLNKSTLLTDALCTALGLSTTATPTQAMEKLRQMVVAAQSVVNARAMCEVVSYTGTGLAGNANPTSIQFSFAPKLIICTYSDIGVLSSDMYNIWLTERWTTSYTIGRLFGNPNRSYSHRDYGLKTPDGKRFSWYVDLYRGTEYIGGDPYGQNSKEGEVYRYIGIG